MFSKDFYPTPDHVIGQMLMGLDLTGKTILEPSAGKGNIVDYLKANGAKTVIGCELNPDLREIVKNKCQLIGDDFLKVKPEQISHIDMIVMNPPFSADEKHILHAWEIAPPGTMIIALCNTDTIDKYGSSYREKLRIVIRDNRGHRTDLGDCFSDAERKTGVNVSLIILTKGGKKANEFEGFFIEEEEEEQGNGVIKYNALRDIVNRYKTAITIFDTQLNFAEQMNKTIGGFFRSEIAFSVSTDNKPTKRDEFKKELQKSAWNYIFSIMDMQKYATRGLKQDINLFVERQTHIPFTMRNVYKMLQIIAGTQESRIDKAIEEVFESFTKHTHENRFSVEGWKTNSHFLLNKRIIVPHVVEVSFKGKMRWASYSWGEQILDLEKALCFLTGEDYNKIETVYNSIGYGKDLDFGQWNDSHFFKFRGYKKGTVHLEFKEERVWALINQRIAKILGYPLYEHKTKTR